MKNTLILLYCCITTFFLSNPLPAQEIEELLALYTEVNGQGYLSPVPDAVTTSVNTGVFPSKKLSKGFQLNVGVVASAAMIGDAQRTFTASVPDFPEVDGTVASTIFGENTPVVKELNDGTAFIFPSGFDIQILPLAAPQASISFYGTEIVGRYFAYDLGNDFGAIDLLGYGIRHDISQWIDGFPVFINLGYFHQDLELGNYATASSDMVIAQVGKDLKLISVHGYVAWQQGNFDIAYTYATEVGSEDVNILLETEGSVIAGVGASIKLSALRIAADLSLGKQVVAALGVSLEFGKTQNKNN